MWLAEQCTTSEVFFPIDINKDIQKIKKGFDLVISWHCKQIFPVDLVETVRCINIHPGFNPYNRGWFPQVFSIINKEPCGVTIHIMDDKLDHGPIIYQKEVVIEDYDTSETVYKRIMELEINLFLEHIVKIVNGNYVYFTASGCSESRINTKQDFANLCKLDLSSKTSLGQCIDLLRALTFSKHDNAYFIDGKGNTVYVSINLNVNDNESNLS